MSDGCLIGGAWVPAAAGTLPAEDPSDGSEIGRIARGGAGEIDAAVAAARAALSGDWGRATAAERGRLLARIGRLVEERAEELARLEARDVGKPLTQARADARALARYLEFYGGAADKLTGETIPYLARLHRLHAARAARGDRAHHPLELPDADGRPLGRRRARRRQRLRAEAGRGGEPDRARLRPDRGRGRPAARRAQRRARPRRGGRGGARRRIRASTTSPSPARSRSAPASRRRPPPTPCR